jgi:UDP-2,3-diacylglucosamine pyrophosphatase LpxH
MVSKKYYFISDLHISGGKNASVYEPEKELINFLEELEDKGENIELIIVGDTFGFWEINNLEGVAKLESVIKAHPRLFNCFQKVGQKIRITIIPGNHDYELACYPDFKPLLEKYGIHLEPQCFIERKVAGKKIHIEHGSQYDSFNYISNFGDPNATPLGYYITNKIVGGANKYSSLGRQEWLKDLGSVYPHERIPNWLFSNHFYREMSPILRYTLLPFFLFFSISFFVLAGLTLEKTKVIGTSIFTRRVGDYFPILGDLIDAIILIDIVVLLLFIASAIVFFIPLFFFIKDVRRTLKRYEFSGPGNLRAKKEKAYLAAARKIFKEDPQKFIYVYGHTHLTSVKKIGRRVVINTGAWTKKLKKITSRFLFLPAVYYPSFQLGYFKIYKQGQKIAIEYKKIHKKINPKLTLVQKFVVIGKRKEDKVKIPRKLLIG